MNLNMAENNLYIFSPEHTVCGGFLPDYISFSLLCAKYNPDCRKLYFCFRGSQTCTANQNPPAFSHILGFTTQRAGQTDVFSLLEQREIYIKHWCSTSENRLSSRISSPTLVGPHIPVQHNTVGSGAQAAVHLMPVVAIFHRNLLIL